MTKPTDDHLFHDGDASAEASASGPSRRGQGKERPRSPGGGAEHGERGERSQAEAPGERPRAASAAPPAHKGAVGALIELDREIMKLLTRRATLVSRIRGGRDYAAGPAAIQAEKAVRIAWESGALSFSKDPRFTRQLFTLLQDLKVMRKEQAESASSYHLSPPQKPVSGTLTGPASAGAAQMRLALAACLGTRLSLGPVFFSEALNDMCRLCEQLGRDLDRRLNGAGPGSLTLAPGKGLASADRSLHFGEDSFSLYLIVMLSLHRPGVWRLNGGARLKAADLSALRHALPLFGARLANVVPRSLGLPANLECSGMIPPEVAPPGDLPAEALRALLLAPLVWNIPFALDLAALPPAELDAALAELRPIYDDCGAAVDIDGPRLIFRPGAIAPPTQPTLPLDPVLSAYLLCLPAFAGGRLALAGEWPAALPQAQEAERVLALGGLAFSHSDGKAIAERSGAAFAAPLPEKPLSPTLRPLALALAALAAKQGAPVPELGRLIAASPDADEVLLAQDFFSRLGLVLEDGVLSAGPADAARPSPDWTSPDAYWGMAFALAAFARPGLYLANPGNVGEALPPFWGIYNSLPEPKDPAGKPAETANDAPARRRIIADR